MATANNAFYCFSPLTVMTHTRISFYLVTV
jgi:hypothetical protein